MNKKSSVSITIDQDIVISPEFVRLSQERKLSSTVNDLLRQALNISKFEIPKEAVDIERELQSLNIKRVILEQKRDDIKAEAEKEEKRWRYLE